MVLLLALAGVASAAQLPYISIPAQQFPERNWSLEKFDPWQHYPSWQPEMLEVASAYQEAEPNRTETWATVACRSYGPLLLAVVYYSTDGNCYLAQEPLPVASGQLAALSWQLPRQESAGVSRLMALEQNYDRQLWLEACANPVSPPRPVAGLVAERWFGRQPPQYGTLPWEDTVRGLPVQPYGFNYGSWPACRAWLEPSLSLASKDCWVEFSGQQAYAIDEFGPLGRWQLDWNAQLDIGCQLAPERLVSSAGLLLHGEPGTDFGRPQLPELELEINGWYLNLLPSTISLGGGMQPYYVDVSQYIQPGWNEVSIRVNSSSDGVLLLDAVELWTR